MASVLCNNCRQFSVPAPLDFIGVVIMNRHLPKCVDALAAIRRGDFAMTGSAEGIFIEAGDCRYRAEDWLMELCGYRKEGESWVWP